MACIKTDARQVIGEEAEYFETLSQIFEREAERAENFGERITCEAKADAYYVAAKELRYRLQEL